MSIAPQGRWLRPIAALALAVLATSCAARVAREEPACPAPADPVETICARDAEVRSLRARFRAEVEAAGETRTAEGILLWRAPGTMRVKLFTLAGITVYDAILSGDASRVRATIRQPLADRTERLDLATGETPSSPDADLALVLWALLQPRCAARPDATQVPSAGTFRLDPASARATERDATVVAGELREETLTRIAASGASERVVARYARYDCTEMPPLPRRIELDAPASGWRAQVTILEQTRNVALDAALFVPPGDLDDAGD